jgi:DUF1680 family protein
MQKPVWKQLIVFTISYCLYNTYLMAQSTDPFQQQQSIKEVYQPLPFGAVKPEGWLLAQLQQNLAGFTGHLDSLVPDLILKDDIYGSQRLTKNVKSKDVGALGVEGDWQVQFLWWNSETQGNWLDGYIRSAILANDNYHLARVKKSVDYLLSTQDADGYLGIYDRDLRYQFDNENGELWAKTTVLRGLLAWYDYTKDPTVLTAIERAVQNVMQHYPINQSRPFYSQKPDVGGLSHGLTFTDVLESLYRITGKQAYLDYALFCYKDFSQHILNEDAQYKKLMDASLPLKGHGVHTYEHLRAVAAAYYISGNPQLGLALKNFLQKIAQTTTATGGPVGDEWIGGKKADATTRGYEYCSLHELLHSYAELLIKTGEKDYGDKIERLFFNAAQGARHPELSCIAYLKSDNSYYMTGGLNGDTLVKHQTRYKYSPVHQDAAVCCVPNAGRITPYYIQYMWLRQGQDLVASLLGPSELNTSVDGKVVTIKQVTSYPFSNRIVFEVSANDADFALKIRKPAWATSFKLSTAYVMEGEYIVVRKKWKGTEKVKLDLMAAPRVEQDSNNEYYFTYGALILAHALPATAEHTKSFPLKGFSDLMYTPSRLVVYTYDGKPLQQVKNKKLLFKITVFNPTSKKEETITLRPVAQTILRQVTFKEK